MYFLLFCFFYLNVFFFNNSKNVYISLQFLPYVLREQSQPHLRIIDITNLKWLIFSEYLHI